MYYIYTPYTQLDVTTDAGAETGLRSGRGRQETGDGDDGGTKRRVFIIHSIKIVLIKKSTKHCNSVKIIGRVNTSVVCGCI